MPINLDNYIDVPARIAEFRKKHPEGTLQQVDLQFVDVAGKQFVVYTAAAYRTPDDPRPGMGTAWEPVPGRTPYTRDSEVQNAETSAWGRAIIAAGAADASKIASKEEVRNRTTEESDEVSVAYLREVLAQSGLTVIRQREVVDAAVGRVVSKLTELSAEERVTALEAITEAVSQ